MTQYTSDWKNNIVIHGIARVTAFIWRWNSDRDGQRPILGRFTAHSAVLVIILGMMLLGSLRLDTLSAMTEMADKTLLQGLAQNVDAASPEKQIHEGGYYRANAAVGIMREAQTHTAIPERPRLEIETYLVQAGDTAQSIAADFGLQPTTLMWSNPEMEKLPDMLRIGQELVILPLDGVYHTVEISDTLESIAEKYDVDVSAIVECPFNQLPGNGSLVAESKVIVPGGQKPFEARQVSVSEVVSTVANQEIASQGWFVWPANGYLSQGYWYGHRAIDIANADGTAILASDHGVVVYTGWSDLGYGYLIVIQHADGFSSWYAHLSTIYVVEGQEVAAGQVIAAMGNTGNSTGPHLHYEIRYNGYPTNPLIYLP